MRIQRIQRQNTLFSKTCTKQHHEVRTPFRLNVYAATNTVILYTYIYIYTYTHHHLWNTEYFIYLIGMYEHFSNIVIKIKSKVVSVFPFFYIRQECFSAVQHCVRPKAYYLNHNEGITDWEWWLQSDVCGPRVYRYTDDFNYPGHRWKKKKREGKEGMSLCSWLCVVCVCARAFGYDKTWIGPGENTMPPKRSLLCK